MGVVEILKQVTAAEGGNLRVERTRFLGMNAAYYYSTTNTLAVDYRGTQILLTNEFGQQNIGEVGCILDQLPPNCAFSIETKSLLYQLLNPRKAVLKVVSDNTQLCNFIEMNSVFDALNKVARKEQFEPTMSGMNQDGRFIVSTFYSLAFNDKELAVQPLIQFYKMLIDFFKDKLLRYY